MTVTSDEQRLFGGAFFIVFLTSLAVSGCFSLHDRNRIVVSEESQKRPEKQPSAKCTPMMPPSKQQIPQRQDSSSAVQTGIILTLPQNPYPWSPEADNPGIPFAHFL